MASADPPNRLAEAGDLRASEAFAVLGNETRLAILLALWQAYEPFVPEADDPLGWVPVSFSALREAVGVADSGQFNYHLGELEGRFVRRTEAGYVLRNAGQKLVRAVIAGAGIRPASLEPSPIPAECPHCDSPTAVTYRNDRLYWVCSACDGAFQRGEEHPEGMLSAWALDPSGLVDRTAEEAIAAAATQAWHDYGSRLAGVCPDCSGRVDSTVDACEDHRPDGRKPCPSCGRRAEFQARYVCRVCRSAAVSGVAEVALRDPAVIAFCHDHGVELTYGRSDFESAHRHHQLIQSLAVARSGDDPLRLEVTLEVEDHEVAVTLDGDLEVLDVTPR